MIYYYHLIEMRQKIKNVIGRKQIILIQTACCHIQIEIYILQKVFAPSLYV
jgi:hypothetical protein